MNRAKFFAAVREPLFDGALSTTQVSGTEAILTEAGRRGTLRKHLAYMLATTYHETAATMQPIKERGGAAYLKKMYDINGARPAKARELGNTSPGDGVRYCGRGDVQLTGRRNYERAGKKIGVDLVSNPDLAMVPENAAKIMFDGMAEGWFTDRKLSDYLSDAKSDYVNARRIINGTDDANQIAGYAVRFEAALRAAGYAEDAPKGGDGVEVADSKPEAPQATPVAKKSFLALLAEIFAALLKGGKK